jgi:zinc protease
MMTRHKNATAFFLAAAFALSIVPARAQAGAPAKPQAGAAGSAKKGAAAKTTEPAEQHDLAASDLRGIKKPPLPEFHPQQPKRVQLDNGMVIFLQEDHELPLIDGSVVIRGGAKNEPEDKVGLASIFGNSWRTGGSKTRSGDQLDDLLEARAAKLEITGDQLATFVSISCLKGDFDFVLELLDDLLRNPEFRQDKIDLAKDAVRTEIARRNDDLGEIAEREARKIGYGNRSPYARVPEYATVAAITRKDLLDWHAKYVQPGNMIVTVAGDFNSAEMEARLRKVFSGWAKGPAISRADVPVTPTKAGVYFVAKDDVNQSEIRMVAIGIRRNDPDYYAVEVMNQILSGGFASRLVNNLRTKAGLAYSVGGGVSALFDHPGLSELSMGTKSGTTAEAVQGLYGEMEKMRAGVTEVEVQRAKDAILNSFVFEFDSKQKVMNARANYEFHGYPADFLERFQKGVTAVTLPDVDRVARKYLVRDKFAVLVVGKAADFDKPLSTFGPVTNVDVTIPQPGDAAPAAAPAASNAEGKALLAKVMEGAGGAAKLKAVKSVRAKATITLKAQGISLDSEETQLGEEKVRLKMNTPNGEMVIVATGQAGFMSMAAVGTRDLPASQREDQLKGLRRELWYIAQHAEDPQFAFSAQGKEKVGDAEASVLDISGGGERLRWFVDAKSGRVLRATFQASSPTGPATQVEDYSDWKTVEGLSLPFHVEVSSNGQPNTSVVISSYEINPLVDAKIFEKPQN